ncbi:MAG: hypothetical protein ArsCj_4760 [Arsenophonus endosymbiont of Ceratovacuna japonica]
MGYLIFSFIFIFFSLSEFYQYNNVYNFNHSETTISIKQQAIETINYIRSINNYIYFHKNIINSPNEIVLLPKQLNIIPHLSISHVIFNQRVFVWQPFLPGLMVALKIQTNNSLLLGNIKNHHIIDNNGQDMHIMVPTCIPNESIVYIN